MTYFFSFFLQSLLPCSLLLAMSGVKFEKIKFKSLINNTLIAVIVGLVLALFLPKTQIITLFSNSAIFSIFILFFSTLFFRSYYLQHCFHFLIVTSQIFLWAKDPNIVAITNTDVINSDFILNISAIIFGFLCCLMVAFWTYWLFKQYRETQKNSTALFYFILVVITLFIITPLLGQIILGLIKLQAIELTKLRLTFVAKTNNLMSLFNYVMPFIMLIMLIFFTAKVYFPRKKAISMAQDLIEKRKKLALFQRARKLQYFGLILVVIISGSQCYWDQVASRPPQLSTATQVTLQVDNQIHIPIAQVNDGKLHRFVWIANDGKAVRFFVINRLENKLSLAVVFDACLLCGDAGYVMQDGQVVCIGCGVRMFIPSIGKPGGCNPVPINDWQQTDSEILISQKSMNEGLNLFSTVVEIAVVDPVDGTKLTNTSAEFKYNYNQQTYFFANEKNLEQFRENPENYLSSQSSQGEK